VTPLLRRAVTSVLRGYVRYFPFAPGKRFLWTRVIEPRFAWQSHDFVASTLYGSRMAGNTKELLQQYIYYFGVWEPQLTCLIKRRLKPGDTFVDVGANIGHFSLLASRLVGNGGRVVAIEASPTTFRALQENIYRNRADNVRAVNMAVSDSRGMVKVFRGPESHIGLATTLPALAAERECEPEADIPAAPLTDILDAEEFRNARLVKIDVEGMEWAVVAGMKSLLESGRADLEVTVEVDPDSLAKQGREPGEILRTFEQYGFYGYELENDYSATSYLRPSERRPVRLVNPVDSTVDLVFSRTSAEVL